MKTILITGAAGFIGSHISKYALDNNFRVIGLDNFLSGSKKTIESLQSHKNSHHFTFIEGDICDIDTCLSSSKECDYISHHAALSSVEKSIENPPLFDKNNTHGTLNLLTAAKENNIKLFIFASSASIYGDSPISKKSETMSPNPKSPYAITKLSGEQYCQFFHQTHGLPTVILRYFNVFGPNQNCDSGYASAIPKFISAFLTKTPPKIYGDGQQTRDFVHVHNIVKANMDALLISPNYYGETFNIGSGKSISVLELVNSIKKIMDCDIPITFLNKRPGDIKHSEADIDKAINSLKTNLPIDLYEGLKNTIDWYKNNPK